MKTTRYRAAVVAAFLAAALATGPLLTGCAKGSSTGDTVATKGAGRTATNGLEHMTPAQIIAKAKAALLSATSVHLTGTSSQGALYAELGMRSARLTVHPAGGTLEVLVVGGVYYMRADKAFWTAQANATVARVLGGKYVKVSGAQAGEFKTFLTLKSFADDTLKPTGRVTKGAPTTVDGTLAIPLTDADGTLFVSLEGSPLPLRIDNTKGASKGVLRFTRWNEPVDVKAPSASQVVDLTKLMGG